MMRIRYRCTTCNDGQRFDTMADVADHMAKVHGAELRETEVTDIGIEARS